MRESKSQLVEQEILNSYQALYRLAYSYLKKPEDAMDAVQESVCKALRHADTVRIDTMSAWLRQIVVHTALDQLRRRAREVPVEQTAEGSAEDRYTDTDLMQSLELLEERERNVVMLRYFEDLRLQDIAAVTGEKLSTVKTLLYRSLRKLKITLTEGETL